MTEQNKTPRSRRHRVGESRGSCPPNWFEPGQKVIVRHRWLHDPADDETPGCYNAAPNQCAPRTDDPTK